MPSSLCDVAISTAGLRTTGRTGKWLKSHFYVAHPRFGAAPVRDRSALPPDSDYATPSWSPDGSALAFGGVAWLNGFTKKSTSIRTIDLRSRQVTQLAGSEGLWAPKWSPNGRYITAKTADS